MSWLPWALVALLLVVAAWLLLALAGAARTIRDLRAGDADEEIRHLGAGLAPGAPAPPFRATADDGRPFDSGELAGLRHLVVFADPDCAACAGLVPAVTGAAAARRLPFTVVVSRGAPDAHPPAWRSAGRSLLVLERDDTVSDVFRVDVTPTAFVVDEGGMVVSRGPVADAAEVARLVAEAEGIRIVDGAIADG